MGPPPALPPLVPGTEAEEDSLAAEGGVRGLPAEETSDVTSLVWRRTGGLKPIGKTVLEAEIEALV